MGVPAPSKPPLAGKREPALQSSETCSSGGGSNQVELSADLAQLIEGE